MKLNKYSDASRQEESKETACVEESNKGLYHLMVYNDDHNTFEHVIEMLVRVCHHHRVQAEQCTYIIHFTGRCSVKQGEYPTLKSMRDRLCDEGIQAEIK